MKLLDREPTQEMIEAGREALNFANRISADEIPLVFSYMYDAAPEVKQEPVAKVDANDECYWANILPDRSVKVGQLLYAFPPDAQAEIAKRDARVAELETNINALAREQAQKMLDNGTYSDRINQQAAEITRLKGVIAKCSMALETVVDVVDPPPEKNCSCHLSPPCSDCVDYSGLREFFDYTKEALAAIKEEGL